MALFPLKNRNLAAPPRELSYTLLKIIAEFEKLAAPIDGASEACLKACVSVLEVEGGNLLVWDEQKKGYVLQSSHGEKPLNMCVPADFEFVRFLKMTRNAFFKEEILTDERYAEVRVPALHYFTQLSSTGAVPLFHQDQMVGILNLGRIKPGGLQGEPGRAVLKLCAHLIVTKLMEGFWQQKIKSLEEKSGNVDALKNDMMIQITHELRTPLHGILGLTGLVLEGSDGELNPDQKRHLEMSQAAAQSLLEMVDQMLTLTKVEAESPNWTQSRIPLAALVADVAALSEGALREKGNVFVSHVDPDLFVYGDEESVRQIMTNLIGNGTKFTRDGQIEAHATKSGDWVRVCVKDSGIGISEEEQARIFEAFHQANSGISRDYGGTGLGLAITRKMVEKHGGKIWVDSVKGKGSEFYFTLPQAPQ